VVLLRPLGDPSRARRTHAHHSLRLYPPLAISSLGRHCSRCTLSESNGVVVCRQGCAGIVTHVAQAPCIRSAAPRHRVGGAAWPPLSAPRHLLLPPVRQPRDDDVRQHTPSTPPTPLVSRHVRSLAVAVTPRRPAGTAARHSRTALPPPRCAYNTAARTAPESGFEQERVHPIYPSQRVRERTTHAHRLIAAIAISEPSAAATANRSVSSAAMLPSASQPQACHSRHQQCSLPATVHRHTTLASRP
jgi:hypothetical protein